MGNELSQIDDCFFICGVDALQDVERLKEKKITFVLNVGKKDLYKQPSWRKEPPLGKVLEVNTALVHHILRTW